MCIYIYIYAGFSFAMCSGRGCKTNLYNLMGTVLKFWAPPWAQCFGPLAWGPGPWATGSGHRVPCPGPQAPGPWTQDPGLGILPSHAEMYVCMLGPGPLAPGPRLWAPGTGTLPAHA